MTEKIRETILSILESKQRSGDVLPYVTSIEVAHALKMNAQEVEMLAKGIEDIVSGRALNHEYYYV